MRDFDQTVRDYRAAMMRRSTWLCRNNAIDPEELLQEAWLDLWKMWPRIRPGVGITALLFRILGCAAGRLIKEAKAAKRTGVTVPIEEWSGGRVEATQEAAAELALVSARLDRIPERQRRVLVSRALGDGLAEVADRLDVSVERVRQIEAQARRGLTARRFSRKG